MNDIKDYEGLYKIDENGNVFTLRKKRFLKPHVDKWGYLKVTLTKNKISKSTFVHRLVAINFINNLENKPQVNHIDMNKQNNNKSNLEWVNNSENIQHAYDNGSEMGFSNRKVKIKQIDIETNQVIKIWDSIQNCSRTLGIPCQNISAVICGTGYYKSAGGFRFERFND